MSQEKLYAPANGEVLTLKDTNDPIFSAETMGKGFGVKPSDAQVVAPVSGTISMIAETKHAIGIVTEDGLEVLVHMGIDTVSLKGKGFTLQCKPNQTIKAGEPIAQMDLEVVQQAGLDTTIMVIITNTADKLEDLKVKTGACRQGEAIATAFVKGTKKKKAGKKDYDALAAEIIDLVGGEDNINNVIHCITRLRFFLKDDKKAHTDELKDTNGVIDVMKVQDQYQVVIGQDVETVFDAVTKQLGSMDNQPTASSQNEGGNWLTRGANHLIGVITGSMSPVVGVIAASGIIKGILALLTLPQLGSILSTTSTLYMTISAMADAAFFFLPVLVGFSAAKRLGGDPMITAVVGAFLTYPQLVEWGKNGKVMFDLFGLHFNFINYTYSIFPMIVAAWLVKVIGNWLKQHLPTYLRSIFTPLFTILIVSTITIVVTGPVIQGAADEIAKFITWIVSASGWIGGLIIGGFYQVLVIFGLHWGVVPLIAQQIASTGETPLNAIISITMVAQGAAVLAVAMKSRKPEMKELGYAGAISAFCGVTEPAIYGVNLRFKRVFVSGLIGSACGGFITGLMHGSMYGFTGSLIGFSSFFNPKHPTDLNSFYAFLISSAVAIVVSFLITWFWGYNDQMTMGSKVEKKKRPGTK